MARLLQYNLAFNNGVNCINHYTNFKVQTIFQMFAQILNIVYMRITTINLDQMSTVSSCI
jgi:hypothetical protein